MNLKNILPKFFSALYFIILFLPPIPDLVLDINTFRLYVFSIINTIALAYILSDDSLSTALSKVIKDKLSLIILAFIFWGLLSYTYAFNKTEVIVRVFTFVNFYLTYVIISVFIKNISFKEISFFVSVILIAQVSFSLYALDVTTTLRAYDFDLNSKIIGIFPNRNITAALYLVQLPFLIYLIRDVKNKFYKLVLFILSIVVVYILFLLASRTSYVIMTGLLILNLIFFMLFKRKSNSFIKSFFGNLTLIIILGYVTTSLFLGSQNTANPVNRVQSIFVEEESSSTRIRYYTFAIKDFISSPIIGYGLGNFKIISIERDKENIRSYTVPYVMHNDFLEVAVELGIIGLSLFLLIFIYPIYVLIKSTKIKNLNTEHLVLLSMLFIYVVDSNLNFPFTRAASLLYLALILAMFNNYLNPLSDENN
jgi:O-antigen ligase